MALVNSKLNSICVSLVLLCTGCASTGPLPESETLDYKSRAITHSDGSVVVSASALSADESRDIYGLSIDKIGVQPVYSLSLFINFSTSSFLSFLSLTANFLLLIL